MKISLLNLFFIISLTFTLFGCSSENNVETSIQEAEMALVQGDVDSACSMANKITQGKNLSGLTTSQLGRLSLVYMQIADTTEPEENISKATELYRTAYATNPDSALIFYTNVERDHLSHAMMLASIVNSMESLDLEVDSIPFGEIIPKQEINQPE